MHDFSKVFKILIKCLTISCTEEDKSAIQFLGFLFCIVCLFLDSSGIFWIARQLFCDVAHSFKAQKGAKMGDWDGLKVLKGFLLYSSTPLCDKKKLHSDHMNHV